MVVLVTGGSGFVGSHLIARLAASGRHVRVLSRDRGRLDRALAPHGATSVEVMDGDVRDPAAVAAAVDGCDAVVHAANVYSLDVRRRREMHDTNVAGTRTVLDAAIAAGCDPVVHVSSMTALLPAWRTITDDPPIGSNEDGAYVGSKVRAERIARARQEAGAPVVTTYPGAVWGPQDPAAGEMVNVLGGTLSGMYALRLGGNPGFTIADVRWVADAHAGLLTPGQGPRRVTMGGRYLTFDGFVRLLRSVTGRPLRHLITVPRTVNLATGRLADAVRQRIGLRLPLSHEQMWLLYGWPPTEDRHAEAVAGPPPPPETTLGDAIRWLVDAGHLSAKRAGAAVGVPA